MKRVLNHNLNLAAKRYARRVSSKRKRQAGYLTSSRKNPWKRKRGANNKVKIKLTELLVSAPNKIDFYSRKLFDSTNNFIKNLQSAIKQAHNSTNTRVKLCFRDTEYISAAAALYLLAETDRTIKIYPNAKFIVTYPKAKPVNITKIRRTDVHSILNRLGFYRLLGKNPLQPVEQANVKCWDYVSGEVANGELAANLIDKFVSNKVDVGILYRGAVEALSNAVEHAYSTSIQSSANISDKRWWMLIAKLNDRLVVLICDLGHGIPNTLEITQPPELLKRIWNVLGGKNQTDGQYIEASTLVKKTRTDKKHRGKGGRDLTSLVDNYNNSVLSIFSMKGIYRYVNKRRIKGVAYDHKSAINGTIVEWSIPITGSFETK